MAFFCALILVFSFSLVIRLCSASASFRSMSVLAFCLFFSALAKSSSKRLRVRVRASSKIPSMFSTVFTRATKAFLSLYVNLRSKRDRFRESLTFLRAFSLDRMFIRLFCSSSLAVFLAVFSWNRIFARRACSFIRNS